MAHKLEDGRPVLGMDVDSDDRSCGGGHDSAGRPLPYVHSRYSKNIRTAINRSMQGQTLTNVQGTVPILKFTLPYSGGVWPVGVNKCIGAVEDTKHNTIIFFVWNSNGNNQILRYYRNHTDPQNIYGEVQQVMLYNPTQHGQKGWGWTKKTRITSVNIVYGARPQTPEGGFNTAVPGDLLYWCDPVPRYIDLTRGNICNKQKSYVVYSPYSYNSFTLPTAFNFTLEDFNGSMVLNATVQVPVFNDPTITAAANNTHALENIATQLNALYGVDIKAEACGCALTITETAVISARTFYYNMSGPVLKLYPQNWYGTNTIDRYFDRCMWQPLNVPLAQYMADQNYLPNNVKDHVFQFRLRYTYTNASPSACGLWSQIPINNLQCDGTNNPLLNYIDVNFNDRNLTDIATLVIFNEVWFIARELNTGADRIIKQLSPCDFLDFDGQNWYCHYKFYNNINSTALDVNTAAQLFDDVPVSVPGGEIFVKNLMVEGGITTGYTGPECTDASYKVQITPVVPKPFYRIRFKIRVWSWPLTSASANNDNLNSMYSANTGGAPTGSINSPFTQAKVPTGTYPIDPAKTLIFERGIIGHDTTRATLNYPYFGGGGYNGATTGANFNVRAGMETDFNQLLPEGGWPLYLAGTPYFGVSRQTNLGGLPTDDLGALDTSTNSNKGAIGTYLATLFQPGANGDLYSEVEVLAPAGDYVARLGSHWCSFGDKLGYGFMYDLNGDSWRRSSTNVLGVYQGGNGSQPMNVPGAWQYTKEIRIHVTGDDLDAGTFVVMDLAPPWFVSGNSTNWHPVNAYLYDSVTNGQIDVAPNDANYNGVAVEKTMVQYDFGGGSGISTNLSAICTTDANGYFFGIIQSTQAEFVPIQVGVGATTSTNILWGGNLTDYINKALKAENLAPSNGLPFQLLYGIVATQTAILREQCSTLIKGTVLDQNGLPVPQISALYENGKFELTDINGNFEIFAWGDMVTPNIPSFVHGSGFIPGSNRIVDHLFFTANPLCNISYPNGQVSAPVNISLFGANIAVQVNIPPYSPTSTINTGIFNINEIVFVTQKKFKRGGKYVSGIRCNDYPGRLCTVVEQYEIYIPFDTEDLSLYPYVVDPNGNPWPPGSYILGQPNILWSFAPGFNPPDWAVSYDLMFTKDTFYSSFLQWVVNGAQYVSQLPNANLNIPVINTAYQNGDAIAVMLDISNIAIYAAQNAGSTVGYTWNEGDRIRLIADRNNQLLHSPSKNLGQTGTMYDYPITGTYTPTVTTGVAPDQLIIPIPELPFEIQSGFTIEIYTPAEQEATATQILYEMGQHFNCTAPGTGANRFGTTSGVLTCGDTYWRGRLIEVSDSVTQFTGVYPVLVEAQDVSDRYASIASDIGRPGIIDPRFVQLFQPTTMISSGTFLPGTALNGLSTFDNNLEANAVIDKKYGQIQRLFFEQNNLLAVCSSKEVSNYIERQILYDAQANTGVVSINGEFFGTQFIHAQNLGTDHPASCVTNSGKIFGWTNARSNVWRYLDNGEGVISDKKFITWFKQLTQDGVSDAVAVYDRFNEEYIITYWRQFSVQLAVSSQHFNGTGPVLTVVFNTTPPPYYQDTTVQVLQNGVYNTYTGTVVNVVAVPNSGQWIVTLQLYTSDGVKFNNGDILNISYSLPETLSWFEGTKMLRDQGRAEYWSTFYDFTPENYCALGTELISFVDGMPWIHDKSPFYNVFYGQVYDTVVTPVLNEQAMDMKVWNALWMKTLQANGKCDWGSPDIHNMYGQLSRLQAANWRKLENGFYQAFKRDLTDATKTDPIINGRVLRSEALTIRLENSYAGNVLLYALRGNFTLSERTSK